MKKLCTYLTLLVLTLLGFAQPASAAVNFESGRTYYVDVSRISGWSNSVVVYDGSKDITATSIGNYLYKYTQSASGQSTVYVKEKWSTGYNEVAVSLNDVNDAVIVLYYSGSTLKYDLQKVRIAGEFISSGSWGNSPTGMNWDSSQKCYTYENTSSNSGNFMVSLAYTFWNGRYYINGSSTQAISTNKSSLTLGGSTNLNLPVGKSKIYFDPDKSQIWYEVNTVPEPSTITNLYITGNNEAGSWGTWKGITTKEGNNFVITLSAGTQFKLSSQNTQNNYEQIWQPQVSGSNKNDLTSVTASNPVSLKFFAAANGTDNLTVSRSGKLYISPDKKIWFVGDPVSSLYYLKENGSWTSMTQEGNYFVANFKFDEKFNVSTTQSYDGRLVPSENSKANDTYWLNNLETLPLKQENLSGFWYIIKISGYSSIKVRVKNDLSEMILEAGERETYSNLYISGEKGTSSTSGLTGFGQWKAMTDAGDYFTYDLSKTDRFKISTTQSYAGTWYNKADNGDFWITDIDKKYTPEFVGSQDVNCYQINNNNSNFPSKVRLYVKKDISELFIMDLSNGEVIYIYTAGKNYLPKAMKAEGNGLFSFPRMRAGDDFLMSTMRGGEWNKNGSVYAPASSADRKVDGKGSSVSRNNLSDGKYFYADVQGTLYFDSKTNKVYIEEKNYTWDDFDYDVYLRGMLFFGKWAGESKQNSPSIDDNTAVMFRVDEVPGLWSFPISKVAQPIKLYRDNKTVGTSATTPTVTWHNDRFTQNASGVDVEERYHFNFATVGKGMMDDDGFWAHSFHPDEGVAVLKADGIAKSFDDGVNTSQNYAYAGAELGDVSAGKVATLYVDMVNYLAWIEIEDYTPSDEMVKFYFWDKGGDAYDATNYKWWDASSNRVAELYIPGTQYSQPVEFDVQAREYNAEQRWIGYRYEFNVQLTETMKAQKDAGNCIWVRIKKGTDGSKVIERPYMFEATYTQGPISDLNFNHYGDVTYDGDPLVMITPTIRMIYSDVKATEGVFHGKLTADEVVKYPYVNQFRTGIEVHPELLSFVMNGVTEAEAYDRDFTFGRLVSNPTVEFTQKYSAALDYKKNHYLFSGSTGKATITGIDHVNADDDDELTVVVEYTSEGMIFSRSKIESLNAYAGYKDEDGLPLLPTMDGEGDVTTNPNLQPHVYSVFGTNYYVTYEDGEEKYEGKPAGYAVKDGIIDMRFNFREKMQMTRAAYVGFRIDKWTERDSYALENIPSGDKHAAENGRPLTWNINNPAIKVHPEVNWHHDAFLNSALCIQIHHVAASSDEHPMQRAEVDVNFYIVVPVATKIEVTPGLLPEEMDAAETRNVKSRIPTSQLQVYGDPENPYTNSISAGNREKITRTVIFGAADVITGIENVEISEENGPVEYYNLQGMRVNSENLTPGIYIVRQGKTASKVYIR